MPLPKPSLLARLFIVGINFQPSLIFITQHVTLNIKIQGLHTLKIFAQPQNLLKFYIFFTNLSKTCEPKKHLISAKYFLSARFPCLTILLFYPLEWDV